MLNEIDTYEPYILNDINMSSYLKYKMINTTEKTDKIINNKNLINKQINKNDKPSLFIPKENDTLFWCYYIIKNGDVEYEMLNSKNTLIERQLKINYITKIRENKSFIKTYKFDSIVNIENNLANDKFINIKTLMSLFLIDKINIVFIKKNTYYELLLSDNSPIYIIREIEIQSKYTKRYGFEISDLNMLNDIRSKLFKCESLEKPIKGISSYKVSELIDIANRLAIETVNKETGKQKTKNELYEKIIQYF